MKEVIGIDVGGTGIKAGLVKGEKLLAEVTNPTPKTNYKQVVIDAIIETVKQIITQSTESIGIGIPSVVDREKGIVYDVCNIPSWKEVPIKEILEKEFGIPVFVDNDANCFAIGERIYGKGKDYPHFVGIATGTGLGAGIIQNGRLLQDSNCGSGEFGIVPYLDSDYEHYCSGMYFESIHKDGQQVYESAKAGDADALKIMKELGVHIGNVVKLVVSTIDPQMIVFGGSVAQSFQFFEKSMHEELKNYPFQNSIQNLKIEVSEMDNPAILGAAALCY